MLHFIFILTAAILARNLIQKIHIDLNSIAFEDVRETNFVFKVVLKTNHAVMEVCKNGLKKI